MRTDAVAKERATSRLKRAMRAGRGIGVWRGGSSDFFEARLPPPAAGTVPPAAAGGGSLACCWHSSEGAPSPHRHHHSDSIQRHCATRHHSDIAAARPLEVASVGTQTPCAVDSSGSSGRPSLRSTPSLSVSTRPLPIACKHLAFAMTTKHERG